jgi:chromate transporter
MPNILWSLAVIFVPLSLVTIGGGQSVVAEIHRQVVDVHHWMTEAQFLDTFAISRMAPGPGSILVTLIGWRVAGFWGAVVSTLSIFVPTSFLIYGVAHLWRRYEGTRWQKALELGLRPVAAGIILAAAYVLLQALHGGWIVILLAFLSAAFLLFTRVNPFLLIGAGAALFMGLHEVALV